MIPQAIFVTVLWAAWGVWLVSLWAQILDIRRRELIHYGRSTRFWPAILAALALTWICSAALIAHLWRLVLRAT